MDHSVPDAPDDGGPAFPIPDGSELREGYHPGFGKYSYRADVCTTGLTIRDWFAGQALHAMLAVSQLGEQMIKLDPPAIANAMYSIADAMLKHRKEKKP